MEQYPALDFMVRYGNYLAVLTGLVPVGMAVAGIALDGWPWGWAFAGLAIGLVACFGVRVFTELVRVIVDMLLPQ